MNNNYLTACLNLLLCISIIGCTSNETQTSQPQEPTETSQDPLTNGRRLFMDNCSICHGSDGMAGISNAANLRTSKLDTAAVIQTITDGRATMPAFKSQLSKEQIEELAAFVHSLRK